MITSFNDVYAELKEKGICKKLVVAWGVDEHSIEAAYKAVEKGFVTATLVGDAKLIADTCAKNGMDVNKPDGSRRTGRRAHEGPLLYR